MAWPDGPHIDRRTTLTGVYSGGTGLTTWTLPYTDTTIDTVVLTGSGHIAANLGKIIDGADLTNNAGASVSASGDYSADEAVVGRAFSHQLELNRPYEQRQDGSGVIDARVNIRRITAAHRNTGGYTISVTTSGRVGCSATFSKADTEADEETGSLTTHAIGAVSESRVFITNDTPRQSNISGVEMLVDASGRRTP